MEVGTIKNKARAHPRHNSLNLRNTRYHGLGHDGSSHLDNDQHLVVVPPFRCHKSLVGLCGHSIMSFGHAPPRPRTATLTLNPATSHRMHTKPPRPASTRGSARPSSQYLARGKFKPVVAKASYVDESLFAEPSSNTSAKPWAAPWQPKKAHEPKRAPAKVETFAYPPSCTPSQLPSYAGG